MKNSLSVLLLGLASALRIRPAAVAPPVLLNDPTAPRPRRRTTNQGKSSPSNNIPHKGWRDRERAEKRAANDLRACRMNYPGWCGYEEAGSALPRDLADGVLNKRR